jgi:hypothetical protein
VAAWLEAEPPSPHRTLKLFGLHATLREFKEALLAADAAREQRAKEFAVMRDTVFGTDKAVELALEHLMAKKLAPAKIAEFKRRVAEVSTPEQVALIEAEVSK